MAKPDAFENEVRQALNHLGNPVFLRSSPLVQVFSLQEQDDPAAALRQVLEQAIETLRPALDAKGTRCSRYYAILVGRYVQQLTQNAVANRLGITPRHLRREQMGAILQLTDYLRLQFDLSDTTRQISLTHEINTIGRPSVEMNREMLWLVDALRDQTSEVDPVLREALDLVQALARRRDIASALECGPTPPVAMPGTVLKQIVLNLLTAVIRVLSPGGKVSLAAHMGADHLAVSVTAAGDPSQSWSQSEGMRTAADVSRRLAELFGGSLTLSEMDDILVVNLRLPYTAQQITVLAIEDNLDTLRMWKRYLQKTHYSLVEETDPTQALATAIRLRPGLIVLDIMMTGIDGWEVLRCLRNHPSTAGIPIIVCTVLPQQDLALSLGANGFIQKPTTGREFRAALEGQSAAAVRQL